MLRRMLCIGLLLAPVVHADETALGVIGSIRVRGEAASGALPGRLELVKGRCDKGGAGERQGPGRREALCAMRFKVLIIRVGNGGTRVGGAERLVGRARANCARRCEHGVVATSACRNAVYY